MSTPELTPLTPRPWRGILLALLAVLATTAVVGGIILGTVGLVRTTQLAKANSALLSANHKLLAAQCDAQQVIIQYQARGIRSGPDLFANILPPDKLDKAIRASKHDLRRLRRVRTKLECPAPDGAAARVPTPDTVLDARHRPRNGEQAVAASGGGTSNGTKPRSPAGPPAGGPGTTGPQGPPGAQGPAGTPAPEPQLPRIPSVCGTAAVPLVCP